MMKKVYICSRYRADENHTVSANIRRALTACGVALDKGYAPIAPHLIYPRCLDDDVSAEREIGLAASKAWIGVCDEVWQWGATVSEGMAAELALARELGIQIKVFNSIGIPKESWNHQIEFISYDGKYPNLCSGTLTFMVDGETRAARHILRSTGGINPNYEGTYEGEWELDRNNLVFSDFGEKDFALLTDAVNQNVEFGCCGGCI